MMPIPIGFAAPWVLAGLLALPALWLLLRAVPPRAREVVFPGTALLLGLADPAPITRHTPWWLLVLRLLAVAAVILALAGPVWKPGPQTSGSGPLLVLADAGWAAAPGVALGYLLLAATLFGIGALQRRLPAEEAGSNAIPATDAVETEA